MSQLHSAFGLLALLLICWLSGRRQPVAWRVVLGGMGLQLVLAALLLQWPLAREVFLVLNRVMGAIDAATGAGAALVFGYLGGGGAPFEVSHPANGFVLAFRALPIILVMSALSALLFHWRVLPWLVRLFSLLLQRTLGIGGALGVGTAANVFVGMVEAPLMIRPYLLGLQRGELFAVMVCGMATIAGTVMVLYASFLANVIPDAMGHIMTASLLSAPAALVVAALYLPWPAGRDAPVVLASEYRSSMDAITDGTVRGVQLLIQIVALLLVLVALVHLFNQLLGWLPRVDGAPLSLQRLLGWVFAPLAWLTGIPWTEALAAGQLLGTKVVLNELIAYLDLARLDPATLSERSRLLITYALCGFANLGSLGILLGGLGAMLPERRDEVVALGLPSIWVGLLATLVTAAVAGLFIAG